MKFLIIHANIGTPLYILYSLKTSLNLQPLKTLLFHLEYTTKNGNYPVLAFSVDGKTIAYMPLHSTDQTSWKTELTVPDDSQNIRYAYQIKGADGGIVRTELNSWRIFHFCHRTAVCFADAWADQTLSTMFHRSAFSQCIMLPRGGEKMHMELVCAPHLLILHALPPQAGYKWAVVGNTKRLGEWKVENALFLQRTDTYEWTLPLTKADFEDGFEYKYLLLSEDGSEAPQWEEGGNRQMVSTRTEGNFSIVRQDELPRINLPHWKGAGCVIPVFSLRSEYSMGVGDFGDLLTLIRWASEVGMKAVQLLPINDTTRTGHWQDSYPYNGISVFALHPLYLDMSPWKNTSIYATFAHRGEELNHLPMLDYEQAFALKIDFLKEIFKAEGKKTMSKSTFRTFVNENQHWLPTYAAFCTLRDYYHTADFRTWPANAPKATDAEKLPTLLPELKTQYNFHIFTQYLLHEQMLKVHEEARQLGVIIKGDIPIGISRDSVPAWADGRLFHFDGQAGAPPDDFAVHGQNWGFPTYNWEEMAKDGYHWWRNRLKHMERYFDAYRIDHVLGFFRIWEVPTNQVYGLLGQFRPALPYTIEEIRDFGFQANVQELRVPFVTFERAKTLERETGNTAFIRTYLERIPNGYVLKRDFRSQRYTEQTVHDETTRKALLDLACEVMFIPDNSHPELFHPRVMARNSHRYQLLSSTDRQAFDHLHDHFFYERNNQFWADEAMKKVPAVTSSSDTLHPTLQLFPLAGMGMLPCAEDLGMVPASVKGVLERLQILSLEIQRMPKAYGLRFGHLADNPYLSVATIATHDMPPLRLWWTENAQQTQDFWNQALHHEGTAPVEATPEVCEEIIRQHLQSPSMLCLLALQDWLSISSKLRSTHPEEEQINVPANPHQYWRYRMHITLDTLLQSSGFNDKVRNLIESAEE